MLKRKRLFLVITSSLIISKYQKLQFLLILQITKQYISNRLLCLQNHQVFVLHQKQYLKHQYLLKLKRLSEAHDNQWLLRVWEQSRKETSKLTPLLLFDGLTRKVVKGRQTNMENLCMRSAGVILMWGVFWVAKAQLKCGFGSFEIIIQFQMSKAIKKLKYKAKEVQSCPVCMVHVVNCQTVQCSHQFCYRCLSKWGRRKGNCPLCRTNIRKIHYKKKIIEPQYLKYFDDQGSIQPSEEAQQIVRPTQARTNELVMRNFTFFMPLIANFQTMNYYHSIPYVMFPNSSA